MIASKDYKSYLQANENLFQLIDDNSPVLHDRFHDVIIVLNYICTLEEESELVEEEFEIIFETGFSYLHEQLETIKIYYKNYLKENLNDFKKYENAINYILMLDDFTEALKEKNLLHEEIETAFTDLGKKLDQIIMKKENFTDEDIDYINATIDAYIAQNDGIYTTDYIFSLIVDELEKYVLK